MAKHLLICALGVITAVSASSSAPFFAWASAGVLHAAAPHESNSDNGHHHHHLASPPSARASSGDLPRRDRDKWVEGTFDPIRGFMPDGKTPKFHGKTPTELDEYVYRDDGAFSITDLKQSFRSIDNTFTTHLFNFTSQKWLTPADSSMPIWWHVLAVIVPDGVDKTLDTSFLYITGETNKADWVPSATSTDIIVAGGLAVGAKTTAAVLFHVPCAPIYFQSDPWGPDKRRTEDAIIAFTWWKYITMGKTKAQRNAEWILELPMTKAGVKAIDVMQSVIPTLLGDATNIKINKVSVAGASKRGWTSWLVGAVEAIRPNNRVAAIIPMVLDAVNVYQFLHRQYTHYGKWTFALKDYIHCNITELIDSEGLKEVFEVADMWYYLDRLTMPKLVLSAGGDEFQMPDNHRFFGHHLPAEAKFLLVKNAEHSLITGLGEVLSAGIAFISSVQRRSARPEVSWSIDDATGRIDITTSAPPLSVNLTYSDSGLGISTGKKDFRWAAMNVDPCIALFGGCIRPLLWATEGTQNIVVKSSTSFSALAPPPPAGQWRVFTVELTFHSKDSPQPLLFTVPASVIPIGDPFPPCTGSTCGNEMC